MELNFQEINHRIISNGVLSFIYELFGSINGRQYGSEWCIGDIYGNPSKKGRGSLSINIRTGVWKDFSSSDKGGDLIDLYAVKNNLTTIEAAKELAERYNVNASSIRTQPTSKFIPIFPIPNLPTKEQIGKPDTLHIYKAVNGDIINYIRRYEGKPKRFLPLSYGNFNNITGWHDKQLPGPRPLYGLEQLSKCKDSLKPDIQTIVIVEGEKTADFLRTKINYPVLTWSGGSQAVNMANWLSLQENFFDVVLWADNDKNEVSLVAMNNIQDILSSFVCNVRMVNIDKLFDTKEGQDACDLPRETNFNKIIDSAQSSIVKPIEQIDIPDGLIKDTVEWIVKTSKYPQYNLAVLNVLAFLGSIVGRRYKTYSGVRGNIFTVAIARTGAGKNHSRSCIEILAAEIGCSHFLGQEIFRSVAGTTRDIFEHPSRLIQMDEFGSRMKALASPESIATNGIAAFMTQIYSSSHKKYSAGKLADKKSETIEIESPNLNIYGTATEAQYAESLTKTGIENGQFNRFIVLPAFKQSFVGMKRSGNLSPDVPKELAAKWRKLVRRPSWLPQSASIKPDITEIPCSEEAKDAIDSRITDEQELYLEKSEDDIKYLLYARLQENTQKLALLFAVARDFNSPYMILQDVESAENLVKISAAYMIELAGSQISENSYHKEHLSIVKLFKQIKKVTISDLTRKMQHLKKQERDSIIANLIESEQIEKIQEKQEGSQKPTTYYKWIGK